VLLIFAFHVVLIVTGCLAAIFLPVLNDVRRGEPSVFVTALSLAVVGIVLLFLARLPLYREGKVFVFGPGALPKGRRWLYWIAYGIIAVSVVTMTLLILVHG